MALHIARTLARNLRPNAGARLAPLSFRVHSDTGIGFNSKVAAVLAPLSFRVHRHWLQPLSCCRCCHRDVDAVVLVQRETYGTSKRWQHRTLDVGPQTHTRHPKRAISAHLVRSQCTVYCTVYCVSANQRNPVLSARAAASPSCVTIEAHSFYLRLFGSTFLFAGHVFLLSPCFGFFILLQL